MDEKIAYLQMIQSVITRMDRNSFLIKGWSITVVVALASRNHTEVIEGQVMAGIVAVREAEPAIRAPGLQWFRLQMEMLKGPNGPAYGAELRRRGWNSRAAEFRRKKSGLDDFYSVLSMLARSQSQLEADLELVANGWTAEDAREWRQSQLVGQRQTADVPGFPPGRLADGDDLRRGGKAQ